MWELAKIQETEIQRVEEYLRLGFQPFAVSQDTWGVTTIWMKKETEEIEQREIQQGLQTKKQAKTKRNIKAKNNKA